jgi:hypothetical protein
MCKVRDTGNKGSNSEGGLNACLHFSVLCCVVLSYMGTWLEMDWYTIQGTLTSKSKKVQLSLWFNWTPRRESVLGEWRYSSTHSLTSALDGGEWSASRAGRFTPWQRVPGTHWIGGWVGPRAAWTRCWGEKFPVPAGNRNLEPRSSSP